ncbi:MAG: DUF3617 domain-containing protein [Rhizobacter sp.]
MRSTFPALLLAAGIALPAVGIAQPAPIKPGLWQMHLETDAIDPAKMREMEQQMKSMPPEQRQMIENMMKQHGMSMSAPGDIKVCLSKEQLAQNDGWQGRGDASCKSDTTRSGNTWKFHQTCPEPNPSETNGEATFVSPEKYMVKSTTTRPGDGKGKTTKMNAVSTWLGADCGDIKPIAQPKRK